MDPKKAKTLLLDAREAIKKKDFETATSNSKEVLRFDRRNYNAWVYLGIVAQETKKPQQALEAFRNAIDISPSQLLAWKGLRAFYEKGESPEYSKELIDVYLKLIELYKDDADNLVDTYYRLSSCYKQFGQLSEALDCLESALKITGKELCGKNLNLWNAMALWLLEEKEEELHQDQYILLKAAMNKISEGKLKKVPEYEAWTVHSFEKYLDVLLKAKDYRLLNDVAENLVVIFGDVGLVRKWQLHAFISSCVDDEPFNLEGVDGLCDSISESEPENYSFVHLARGARFYVSKNWVDARDNLLKGLHVSRWCWESWLLLCWTLERLCDGNNLEKCAIEGRKALNCQTNFPSKSRVDLRFQLCRGKGLVMKGTPVDLKNSISVLWKVSPDALLRRDMEYYEGIARLKLQDWREADNVLNRLQGIDPVAGTALEGMINCEKNNLEEAKNLLLSATQRSPENGDWLLQLGIVFWKMKDHEAAFDCFLKSAKLNPYNSKTFLMLGHYYKDVMFDLMNAATCLKLAYDLNRYDEDVGLCLSSVYEGLNDEAANLRLLNEVTRNASPGSCKWAWLRLGLIHLKREDPKIAVKAFQTALQADALDREAWQCLAEAYVLRGSYNAALKAFTKALEVEPQLLYCTYQIANIKLLLGNFEEAADTFLEVVKTLPLYTPALKGLGEAYLAQASVCLQNCLSSKVVSLCESALDYFTRALEQKVDFICVWKLLGDACTILGRLSKEVVRVKVPPLLLKYVATDSYECPTLGQRDVLAVGTRCYMAAIRWATNNSSLWHDLGVNCYYRGVVEDSAEKKAKWFGKAIASLKKAVSLKSTSGSHWNALGVAASANEVKNYRLAQHAFIKAVKLEPNHVVAWANLGTLYLMTGDVELANRAFAAAQSVEPAYVNSWIGQAMIAEMLDHEDTMDLFRHCTIIGNHTEGSMGYATWVCSTLLQNSHQNMESYKYNIEQMDAVPAASDCLFRFADIIRDDPCAFNMLGLLLERQGLTKSAIKMLEKALHLLDDSDDVKIKDKVHCNKARVLRTLGRIPEAVEEARAVKESDFYNHCVLASSYYQLDLVDESREAYASALEWLANTDEEKSHLMVKMAAIAYQLRGTEEAKTLLFESFQMKPVCVQGLLALSALGILSSDLALLAAAIDELEPWCADEHFRQAAVHLRACQAIMEENIPKARNLYCKALHMWPMDWEVWNLASKFLLKHSVPNLAINFVSASVKICDTPVLDALKFLMVCFLSFGFVKEGFSIAKKLAHYDPGDANNLSLIKTGFSFTT